MIFKLFKDKIIKADLGDRVVDKTFVEAGDYRIIRVFDKDRVLVQLNYSKPPQITLLRIDDGEIFEGEE